MAVGRLARRFTVVMFVPLLAACGGGGGVASPTSSASSSGTGGPGATYAQGLCGAESTWMTSLQTRTTKMASGLSALGNKTSPPTLVKGKRVMVAYFDGLVTDTDKLISDVQGLGVPNVDGGQAAQAQIIDVFTKIRGLYDKFDAQMKALPTNNLAAFNRGMGQAAAAITPAAQDLGTVSSGMTNTALKDAIKAEPSCASFAGGG